MQAENIVLADGAITTAASGSGDAGQIFIGSGAAPVTTLTVSGQNGVVSSDSSGTGPDAGLHGSDLAAVGTKLEIDILDQRLAATIVEESPYDPTNAKLRA